MASAFGHILIAVTIGKSLPKKIRSAKLWITGSICSVLPDADVISFNLGIPYESFWGHRGFTHSIVFSILIGVLITRLLFKENPIAKNGFAYFIFITLCTASHGLLDAITNGGLGVAFFLPFENSRYFLPWHPIKVSPIGINRFISDWGKTVILSEIIWLGIPCFIFLVLIQIKRKIKSLY
jgi:inner membrane protein